MCLVHTFIKLYVFICNFAIVLIGIALIAFGALYKVDFDGVHKAIPEDYSGLELAPTLTIVVGSLIVVIAFLGCCGSLRMSSCLLTTYAVILLLICLLQIALSIFVFVEVRDDRALQKDIDRTIETIFNKYDPEVQLKTDTNEIVDLIQQNLKCCGVQGPSYWKQIPKSCCDDEDCQKNSNYKEGCQMKMYDFIKKSANIIGIVVLSVAAILVIGAILSLRLANSVRNTTRRSIY